MQMWLPFLAVELMSSDSSLFLFHVIVPSPSFPFPFIFQSVFLVSSISLLMPTVAFLSISTHHFLLPQNQLFWPTDYRLVSITEYSVPLAW